jgi:hypothetical protein
MSFTSFLDHPEQNIFIQAVEATMISSQKIGPSHTLIDDNGCRWLQCWHLRTATEASASRINSYSSLYAAVSRHGKPGSQQCLIKLVK